MIAFLRNFCASLAALIVFFIAVPFAFLVIIAAVIASIGERDKYEVSNGCRTGFPRLLPQAILRFAVNFLKLPPKALLIYALKYGQRRQTYL